MGDLSRKRHIAKTFTWRAVGTLDTVLISWIITGNPADRHENRAFRGRH